jgi:putative copper resistance protein D
LHATRNPWHARIRRVVRSRALSLWFCPPVALASYGVVIVGTHLTGLMGEIMTHPWAGQLEHVVYLLVGYQLFSLVVGNEPLRWRLSMPAKQLLLALAMGVDTLTGVILLQTDQPIQMTGMSPNHVDPLTQTHLGGAIMWVGGDAIMALVMMGVLLAWLRLPDYRRRASRSWLEQARQENLTAHGITTGDDRRQGTHLDDNDQARLAYNEWLQRLDSARSAD